MENHYLSSLDEPAMELLLTGFEKLILTVSTPFEHVLIYQNL